MSPRNETELQAQTIQLAMLNGWRVQHVRPAKTEKGWRTPIQGHRGAPDLLLARGGVAYCWELKSPGGKPTADQSLWLDALGFHGRLLYPADFESLIVPVLTARERAG